MLRTSTNNLSRNHQPSYHHCIVEIGSGILACSLATLRPFFASLVDLSTIRYSVSRFTRSLHNTNTEPESRIKKEISNDVVSSQDSDLYDVQRARIVSMKESFFSVADSQTGVFRERREKSSMNSSVRQP